jgi:hypothetical protein
VQAHNVATEMLRSEDNVPEPLETHRNDRSSPKEIAAYDSNGLNRIFPVHVRGNFKRPKMVRQEFRRQNPFHEFCQIEFNAGGNTKNCSLGERRMGGFNIAVTLMFEDGAERINRKDVKNLLIRPRR